MKTLRSLLLVALPAMAVLSWVVAVLAVGELGTPTDNPLTVYDRAGNAVTVSNRFDSVNYSVQVTQYGPNRGVNWDRIHYDGYQEIANAVALDPTGNVFLAGARIVQGTKYIWMMKYSSMGDLAWERLDPFSTCTGLNVVANDAGESWVAGSCVFGTGHPARLLRLDKEGNALWSSLYDEGGRNYVRGLSVDVAGRASVTVEVSQGAYASGASVMRTVVLDNQGNRMTVY